MLAENVLTCLEPKSQKAHYCFCHPLANITTHYYNLSRGPKGHMLLKRAGFRKLARAVKSWQSGAPHLGSIKHISLWASKQKVHPPPPPPPLVSANLGNLQMLLNRPNTISMTLLKTMCETGSLPSKEPPCKAHNDSTRRRELHLTNYKSSGPLVSFAEEGSHPCPVIITGTLFP